MNDNTLKSGSLLKNGEYRIEKSLGQGGFGITYEAEQVSLGRKVAIKEFFMKDSCERDENTSHVTVPTASNRELVSKFKDKFIREARMIAALDHEHIVKIYDVFEENGTAYYVMEYLGGGSLDRKIKDKGAMPENVALGFIRQIANALGYLHSQNILHFDVKPSNVLLGKNGSAKLIDFGISKHYDESGVQTSSTPVGISKGFAPLEQYQQSSDIKSFTPATDIYSLGATLYALLSGSNPPEASVIYEDGLPIIDGVNPVVMRAIEKAMQPRRKDRPQSVGEFLNLLDGNAEDEEDTVLSGPKYNEKKVEEHQQNPVQNTGKPQNAKDTKDTKVTKLFPKWILGVVAGVVVAVAAVLLWPKMERQGDEDNQQTDSTAVVAEAVLQEPVTSQSSASASKPETPTVIELKSISLSKTTLELEEGSSATLTIKYIPSDATDRSTEWKSTNTNVATVNKSGKVSAVNPGSAKIIAVCCGMNVECGVFVKEKKTEAIAVQAINLNKNSLRLEIGKSESLIATCVPSNATDTQIFWDSSNTSVAVVSSSGNVKAVSVGSATIIAKCGSEMVYCNVTVKEKATSGYNNGHEWVDLGLSVKWATCNVGASSPSDNGSYFAWGETSSKKIYYNETLKYCLNEEGNKYSKYVTSQIYGDVDNKEMLEMIDDAAHINWGGDWRMPNGDEMEELCNECTWKWTTQGGRSGYKVIGKNGRSIFLPSAGFRAGPDLLNLHEGNYFVSTLFLGSCFPGNLFFNSQEHTHSGNARYKGMSVRPVCP